MCRDDLNELMRTLTRNRLMRSRAEIVAWDEALTQVEEHPRRADCLPELYLLFDDGCENTEVMFRLVHLLESFDETRQFSTLIDLAPQLAQQTPWWTEVLHCRILNNPAARGHYKELLRFTSSPGVSAVRAVLEHIRDTKQPPLNERAQLILDAW